METGNKTAQLFLLCLLVVVCVAVLLMCVYGASLLLRRMLGRAAPLIAGPAVTVTWAFLSTAVQEAKGTLGPSPDVVGEVLLAIGYLSIVTLPYSIYLMLSWLFPRTG